MSNDEETLTNTDIAESIGTGESNDNDAAEALVVPDWLPPKFWDAKNQEVRVYDLAKSYKLLEKRLSGGGSVVDKSVDESVDESGDNPVDKSEDKMLESSNEVIESDDNFSSEVSESDIIAATVELEQIFGGSEQWQRLQPQLSSWGRRNLPLSAYEALSSSVEGIQALHKLMLSSGSEPRLAEGGGLPSALDEGRLRQMMQDPRYWREREPEFINKVLRGFQHLYGN